MALHGVQRTDWQKAKSAKISWFGSFNKKILSLQFEKLVCKKEVFCSKCARVKKPVEIKKEKKS